MILTKWRSREQITERKTSTYLETILARLPRYNFALFFIEYFQANWPTHINHYFVQIICFHFMFCLRLGCVRFKSLASPLRAAPALKAVLDITITQPVHEHLKHGF